MRRFLFTGILLLYVLARPGVYDSMNIYPAQGYIVLEDFQGYGSTPFPEWEATASSGNTTKVYSIRNEGGRKFLRASTVEYNKKVIQIGRPIKKMKLAGGANYWDIYKYPCIQWDWRVHILPENANEISKRDDSAAGIYVVFPRKNLPILDWENQPADWIKYVWSTTLPIGTVIKKHKKKYGITLYNGRVIVVATGRANLKKWVTLKRNVLADYRTYFGKKPRYHPTVIGILTDSNSTKSIAVADYDNILVLTD